MLVVMLYWLFFCLRYLDWCFVSLVVVACTLLLVYLFLLVLFLVCGV